MRRSNADGRRSAADRVAVGHTRDDQAETVLLKLLRGAGPRGLAGIYPRKGTIVRPLLDVATAAVADVVADNRITHVEDASNEDVSNPRNLLRHRGAPGARTLVWTVGPAALAQTAEIARADEELLEGLTAAQFARAVRQDGRRALD